jgi:hypothetical protein
MNMSVRLAPFHALSKRTCRRPSSSSLSPPEKLASLMSETIDCPPRVYVTV